MSKDPPPDPLARLAEKLDKARAGHAPERNAGGAGAAQQGAALGFRIGIEFVASIIVAIGLGWAIDRGLGTRPWAMIVMFFLGVAAGMLHIYRAVAGIGMAVGDRRPGGGAPGAAPATDKWDDEEC